MKTLDWKRTMALLLAAPLLGLTCTGCVVAGYSSAGGGFIWPGGLGLLVVILVIVFCCAGGRSVRRA